MNIAEKVKKVSKSTAKSKSVKSESKAVVKKVKPTIVEVFAHSKPKNSKRSRITVAGIINYTDQTISIHGARNNTSLGESFKREIGREVSLGRAKKHPLYVIDIKGKDAREEWYNAANLLMKKPYRINDDPLLTAERENRAAQNRKDIRVK